MRLALFLIGALTIAQPARSGDLLGLENEKSMMLKGEVVDLVCALTGRCAPNCGGGQRQLALRATDGKLYATVKSTVDFAGANADLLPHCGRTIEVDGLLLESPRMRLYLVQSIRARDGDPWAPTNAFLTGWRAKHGPAEEWYRADPTVKEIIGADGVLGVKGLEPPKK